MGILLRLGVVVERLDIQSNLMRGVHMGLKQRVIINLVNILCLILVGVVAFIPLKFSILEMIRLIIVIALGMISLICTAYTE